MAQFKGISGNRYLNLVLNVESQSSDIATNTSVVKYSLSLEKNRAWWGYSLGNALSYNVKINGQTVVNTRGDYDLRNQYSQVIASGTVNINHTSDGSKTIYVEANIYNIPSVGNITNVSGNVTLPTIPRASNSIKVVGNTLGNIVSVNITKLVNSFTHQVWYRIYNSDWVDLGKNINTSINFTPSIDYANRLPDSTSGKMDICIRTYNGSQQIGNDVYFYNYNMNIPESIKPTLGGITLTDKNVLVASKLKANVFAQTLSEIIVKFNNASGAYGSTIKNFKVNIDGKNNLTITDNGSLGIMDYSGNFNVNAQVVDSRGRMSGIVSVPIKVLEYYLPILSFEILRGGADGQSAVVRQTIKVAPLTIDGTPRNRLTVKYEAIESNTTNKTILGTESRTDVFVFNKADKVLAGKLLATKSYEVVGTISDYFYNNSYKTKIGTDKVLMSYAPTGIGIGKIHQNGSLDVAGVANFENINLRGNPVPSWTPQIFTALMDLLFTYDRITWQNVNFNNSWQHYDSNSLIKVSVDSVGTITIRGACRAGKTDWGTTMFVLPEDCRPSQGGYFQVISGGNYNAAIVFIATNGTVSIRRNITNDWVCFDGLSFKK